MTGCVNKRILHTALFPVPAGGAPSGHSTGIEPQLFLFTGRGDTSAKGETPQAMLADSTAHTQRVG